MHFWGLSSESYPVLDACAPTLKQYSWQRSDQVGRDDIARAIESAEDKLFTHLLYSVAPRFTSKTLDYPKYYDTLLHRFCPVDPLGRWISVDLGEGYVNSIGYETITSIAAASPVTWHDYDGDGYNETWSIGPVATTVTSIDEIEVGFSAADRYDQSALGAAKFKVDTFTVTISGGFVTITGPAWVLVRPALYEGFATTAIDPSTAGNYASTLDVYRHWSDPDGLTTATSQAALIWTTSPCSCFGFDTPPALLNSQDPASRALVVARCGIRDAVNGIVTPVQAVYDITTAQWYANGAWWDGLPGSCLMPDLVTIRYNAGRPLLTGTMAPFWQQVVARMAAAELARPICACDSQTSRAEMHNWQFDVTRSKGDNDESYGGVSAKSLMNPFGTRRGHIQAWQVVENEALLRAVFTG